MDERLLMTDLTTTDVQDAVGAEKIVAAVRKCWLWLWQLFADRAYNRASGPVRPPTTTLSSRSHASCPTRSVPSPAAALVVERTFSCMTRWCRLVGNYEKRPDVSKAMTHVSMGALLLQRIAHPRTFSKGN